MKQPVGVQPKKSAARSPLTLAAVLLSAFVSMSARAAVTDIPPGTTDLAPILGAECFLANLGDSFCSIQGDCATRALIDSSATRVGQAVGKGPMVTSKSLNARGTRASRWA